MIAPPRPPSHDDLEALIKEARERQLRRRLLGAAVVAIASAIALSVYAVTIGSGQPATSAGHKKPARVPFCRAGQLSASAGFQGATQTMLGGVSIRNTGDAACSLPQGRPLVTISWRGKPVPTKERPMRTGPPWPQAHIVAPGKSASVFFQWWSCGGPGPKEAVQPTFLLRFGHGLAVTAHSGVVTPAFCSGLGAPRSLDVSRALVTR
jgi:Protein of unknown function (DUF4232)